MTRRELADDMQKQFDRSLLSLAEFREYSKYTIDRAKKAINTVNARNFGGERKGQLYHVLDLADGMFEISGKRSRG